MNNEKIALIWWLMSITVLCFISYIFSQTTFKWTNNIYILTSAIWSKPMFHENFSLANKSV